MIRGLVYSLISASAFASLAILVKIGYAAGMTGPVMMQFRFSFATASLLLILLTKDRSLLRIPFRTLGKCAFLGLVIYWCQTTCFVKSLETIPASTAALVLSGYPIVVTLFSAVFLKMRVTPVVVVSLILVITGCGLVFYDAFLRETDGLGLLYAMGAMAIFSLYLLLAQKLLKGLKPLTATFYVMLFGTVSFTLSGDIMAWWHITGAQAAVGLGLGLIPGVVAITFLFAAVECIGSAYTSIFSSIEPVITLCAAAVFLNETVVILQMGGAALIIVGIVAPNLRARQPVVP